MNYDIVAFDETRAILTVKPELLEPINITLPVDESGLVPSGDILDQYIQGFLPTHHMQRIKLLKNGLGNAQEIHNLVNKDYANMHTPPSKDTSVNLTVAQKMEMILTERDRRLSACDWTQLEDVAKAKGSEWVKTWAIYRQALRDMTDTITDVDKNQFPIPPIE